MSHPVLGSRKCVDDKLRFFVRGKGFMKVEIKSVGRIISLALMLVVLPACELPFNLGCDKCDSASKNKVCEKTSRDTGKGVVKGIAADDKSPVLVRIDGVPRITEDGLNEKFAQMLQADPMAAQLDISQIPLVAKKKFLQDWLNVLIIREVWDKNTGISKTPDFKAALAERVDAIEDALVVEKFVESLRDEMSISESQLKKEYENNKERYAKVAGGARVAAARFDSEVDAKSFLDSLTGDVSKIADFQKLAGNESTAQYRDFGRVSLSSPRGAPDALVSVALGQKTTPSSTFVSTGNDNWVVFVQDFKESEYYAFDEVKPQIQGMLEGSAFQELLNKKIETLKKGASVEIDDKYQISAEALS